MFCPQVVGSSCHISSDPCVKEAVHFTEEQLFFNPLRNHRFPLQLQYIFAVFGCVDSAVVFWLCCGSYNSFEHC